MTQDTLDNIPDNNKDSYELKKSLYKSIEDFTDMVDKELLGTDHYYEQVIESIKNLKPHLNDDKVTKYIEKFDQLRGELSEYIYDKFLKIYKEIDKDLS